MKKSPRDAIRERHAQEQQYAAIIVNGPAAELNNKTEQLTEQEHETVNRNSETEQGTGTGFQFTATEAEQIMNEAFSGALTEQNSGTEKLNSLTEQKTEPEQLSVTDNRNNETDTVQGSGTVKRSNEPVQGIVSGLLDSLIEKEIVEKTHTRDTYLIENGLLSRLNKIAATKPKGFKKKLINHLLRQALDELERGE